MWWHVLGVESTDEQKTVKKAYAAIIKNVDQDKEIEAFTRIHQAYRMAMKSFRDLKMTEEAMPMEAFEEDWYISELSKTYNNPKHRLKASRWADLFACMSFKEEKEFVERYIGFFNEHYKLTDEVWAVVEQNYPLSNQKNFMWSELLRDGFSVTFAEANAARSMDAIAYVENKIDLYLGILRKHYRRCLRLGQMMMVEDGNSAIARWYLVAAINADLRSEAQEAYLALKQVDVYMATYLYGGYLGRQGAYAEALKVLLEVTEEDQRIEGLKREAEVALGQCKDELLAPKPWQELDQLSPKRQKFLATGNLKKGLLDASGPRISFWGGKS